MPSERNQRGNDGVPSNHELAQRTARIEEQVGHVRESVDRIEESVTTGQSDLADQIEDNTRKTTRLWQVYQLGKWVVPAAATVAGTAATLGFF